VRRLLWLTTGLGRGGAERLLVDTAARLGAGDGEVTIAYVLPWKDALVEEARSAGATVVCLGAGRPPLDPRWLLRLARILRRERWDLVHTHAPLPAAAARLLAPRGVQFVHTEHNVWPRYRLPTRLLNALTWRRNRHVLAVSEGVAASITRHGPEVEVVVQGIDVDRFTPGPDDRRAARESLGISADTRVVGTVGNLVEKKDHDTLLRAVAATSDVDVVIVGTGPLEGPLRLRATELGVRLHLLGIRDDVPSLLPAFDVFCLSSRYEGLPIAMLEAMASGVPVVATAVGGVPEVVTDGVDGLLVPAGDAAALAVALEKVLTDPELARDLGVAARATASTYGIARAVDRTRAIYDEVLGR